MPKRDLVLTCPPDSGGSYNDRRIRVHLSNPREPDRRVVVELTPDEARHMRDFLDRALAYEPPPWQVRRA